MLQRVYRQVLNKAIRGTNQRSVVSAALFSRSQTRNITVNLSDKPQEAAADQPAVVYMYTEEDAERLSSVWTKAIATDFKGKAGQVLVHYPTEGSNLYQGSEAQGPKKPHRIVFVGLGKQRAVTVPSVRKAVSHAVDKLKALKVTAATLAVPNLTAINQGQSDVNQGQSQTPSTALVDVLSTMANTSVLADYSFDKYLTRTDNKSTPLASLTLLADSLPANAAQLVREAVVIGECTNYARDLANERAEVATPAYYEQQARQLQAEHAAVLDIDVLQYEELQQHGLNLLAAVGQGAPVLPRLVLLRYRGNPDSTEEIGIVGKGITFDTGGLNLKPTNSIEDMYMDNAGAAAVLGTMKAAAKLNLKVNLRGVLALAENSIGPNAYRPGAIITSEGGPSVEIRNTDAEGRLALADALNWLQRKNSPAVIVDLATLTGACVMALGEYAAGLFSNSTALTQQLQRAADLSGERVWPLPLFEEHSADLKGTQSDIKNIAVKGRGAGASSGAAFLKEFVKEGVQWAHLDIAGTGASSFKKGHVPQGGTGFGVHLLIEWLKTRQ